MTEPLPPRKPASAEELVSVYPPAMRLVWQADGGFALRATGPDEAARLIAPDPARCRTFLDCGLWGGDGVETPSLRTFAALCGRTLVLCEFRAGGALEDVDGPPEEAAALNRALRALAGPQRLDVRVLRWLRIPAEDPPRDADASGATVYVFLPDAHLPIVPKMPELRADLVPDPTQAQCACHGPLLARILRGTAPESDYRAFGVAMSRDPNQWFYLMVESFRPVAEDLSRFVSRLTRLARSAPVRLVQLGGLFEVWAGFKVMYQGTGRLGIVAPQIVRGTHLADFTRRWEALALPTATLEAVRHVARFPAARRTLLYADYRWFDPRAATDARVLERRACHVPGLFYAEHHPPDRVTDNDRPPGGMVAILENQSRFIPWTPAFTVGWRDPLIAYGATSLAARPETRATPLYVMGYSQVPCLLHVIVEDPAA